MHKHSALSCSGIEHEIPFLESLQHPKGKKVEHGVQEEPRQGIMQSTLPQSINTRQYPCCSVELLLIAYALSH